MARYEVKCVTKRPPGNHPSLITHIGNQGISQFWKITRDQAITYIETGVHTFYVKSFKDESEHAIRVIRPETGEPYLASEMPEGGPASDDLLLLTPCI